jgi:hypothetical protein
MIESAELEASALYETVLRLDTLLTSLGAAAVGVNA